MAFHQFQDRFNSCKGTYNRSAQVEKDALLIKFFVLNELYISQSRKNCDPEFQLDKLI